MEPLTRRRFDNYRFEERLSRTDSSWLAFSGCWTESIARSSISFRGCYPWDGSRGCVTIEKLFGYQLRAPKRLVLQVVNELGLFNGYSFAREETGNHPWPLIYIAVSRGGLGGAVNTNWTHLRSITFTGLSITTIDFVVSSR